MIKFGTQSCVYDAVGNPTTYRGKTATWVRGRKLASFDGNSFEYNAQGIRTRKNNIEYYYDSQGRLLKQSNGLEFFYDANGLVGLKYNGSNYVYRTDIQGNVIAILDSSGEVVVQYKYDAWGNQTITGNSTLANINPFRYRSYYFDTETGLYYLQTRYYDPEVGRFLNIDSLDYANPETINGLNLYAYCGNNPVMNSDPEGHFWFSILCAVISSAVNLVTEFVEDLSDGKLMNDKNATDYVGAAVGGFISGFGGGFFSSVGLGVVGDSVDALINGEMAENGFGNVLTNSLFSSISSFAVGGFAGKTARKVASKIKAKKIINPKGVVENNIINKELRGITEDLNIGAKKATITTITDQIFKVNKWKTGNNIEKIISSLF